MKRSSAGGRIRDRLGVSGGVKSLSLPALDLAPASLSCSLGILAKRLTQGLRRVVQDPGAIAKIGGLNVIFISRLADPLAIELLEF